MGSTWRRAIAKTNHMTDQQQELANALLIAAAPEMLQVLKDIIEGFFAEYEDPNNLPDGPTTGAIARAQYIIAKVEGRS